MTLDQRPSDEELLAKAARTPGATINGVRVGPDSPLLKVPKTKAQRAAERAALRAAHADDPIDPNGRMNGYERRRAEELEASRRSGHLLAWYFEEVQFAIGYRTTYTPDFLLVYPPSVGSRQRFVLEEVKGFWRDDARVKIKVAARRFPHFEFRALRRKTKREGGGWQVEAIKP